MLNALVVLAKVGEKTLVHSKNVPRILLIAAQGSLILFFDQSVIFNTNQRTSKAFF